MCDVIQKWGYTGLLTKIHSVFSYLKVSSAVKIVLYLNDIFWKDHYSLVLLKVNLYISATYYKNGHYGNKGGVIIYILICTKLLPQRHMTMDVYFKYRYGTRGVIRYSKPDNLITTKTHGKVSVIWKLRWHTCRHHI